LQPKTNLGGHPLILGKPWLATTDAFIGCRSRSMIIAHGDEMKHITLYLPAQSPLISWLDDEQENTQPNLSINQAFNFREEEENEEL